MRKLNYLVTEITSHFFIKLLLVLMIGIVSLCSVQFFQAFFEYRNNTEALNESIGQNSSFRLFENSYEAIPSKNIAQIISRAEELFSTEAFYYLGNQGKLVAESEGLIPAEGQPTSVAETGEKLIHPNLAIMNRALLAKVGLPIVEGEFFLESDFSGETQGILLGSFYQNSHEIGDEITLEEVVGASAENLLETVKSHYQIRGFISKDFEMLNYWQGSTNSISLDSMLILPQTTAALHGESSSMDVQTTGFFFLVSPEEDQALSYLTLAEEIREIGQANGYQLLEFQNDRSVYNSAIQNYQYQYQNKLYLLGLLLVFSFIQLGVIISFTFKKRQSVYEIYFSIGSTKLEIFLFLIFEYLLLFVVAWALMFLFNSFYLQEIWSRQAQIAGGLFYFCSFSVVTIATLGSKLFKNGRFFRREQ
ncbi:hypothetical protein [Enterococcus sp. LJL90]